MADYCTASELKAELGISDTDDDAVLAIAITAASRQIDGWCGQRFTPDASVTVREYWADSPSCVEIDLGISTATGLIVKTDTDADGTFETTLTIGTDFYLMPRNALADGFPYSEIIAVSSYFPTSASRPGVQVTAKFGFPAVPDDVKKACLVQAAQLFKTKDAVFGAVALGESASMYVRAALNPTAKALLARFQKVPIG